MSGNDFLNDFFGEDTTSEAQDNSPAWALVNSIKARELTVTPYDENAPKDSGKIFDQSGDEVPLDEIKNTQRELLKAFREITNKLGEEFGRGALLEKVTFRDQEMPAYKLFSEDGAQDALNRIFPDHSEDIDLACALQDLRGDLSKIRAESELVAKDGYMVKGLEESGFSFGKPGGSELIQ